jgi:hypothetical protein
MKNLASEFVGIASTHDNEIVLAKKPANRNLQTPGKSQNFVIHQVSVAILDFRNAGAINRHPLGGQPAGKFILAEGRIKPSPGNTDSAADDIFRFESLMGMLHRWIDDPRLTFQEIGEISVLSENI